MSVKKTSKTKVEEVKVKKTTSTNTKMKVSKKTETAQKEKAPKAKKTAAKESKTTKKVIDKKAAKKTTVKAEKPTTKAKTAKKTVAKKVTKKSALKEQESSAKTAAKIIAKAKKKDIQPIQDKPVQSESSEVADKKTDAQKNVIFVKKLSDSRTKVVFKPEDYAVYPSHGVGKIVDIEKTVILGQDFHCYLMSFEKEKLVIKIPTISAEKIGLRHLATKQQMDEVFLTLRSGIKKLKGMWSRRAQEYETKINSGDIMLLAEVLRDLTRDIEDGERSYSERIIYETAVHRLAAEYSVIYGCDFEEAKEKVIATAKDKLGVEGKITQKDEFDEFDYDDDVSDDEDEDEEDEEEDEDDELYGDEKPKKRSRG